MVPLIIIITIICFLLILVILAQNSKGGGLSSQFGGSSTSQIIGVKKTGDFLERFTWGLAIALLVLTLSTDFLIENPGDNADVSNSPNVNKAQDRSQIPPADFTTPIDSALQDAGNNEGTILEEDDATNDDESTEEN